jgi:hypothetical protein
LAILFRPFGFLALWLSFYLGVHQASGITFIRYIPNQKIGKPINAKIFGSKKTKGPKQDSQRARKPKGLNRIAKEQENQRA